MVIDSVDTPRIGLPARERHDRRGRHRPLGVRPGGDDAQRSRRPVPNWTIDENRARPTAQPITRTFNTARHLHFVCTIHNGMTGSVTVEAAEPTLEQGARLLQDRRLPPRLDPAGHRGDPGARHGQRLHGRRDRGRRRSSPTPTSRSSTSSSSCRRPATILNDAQQAAFERYIQAGGGFVGVHAASDTEYTWPWYGELLGGYFRNHPPGTPHRDGRHRGRRRALHDRASGPLDARRTSGTTSSTRRPRSSTATSRHRRLQPARTRGVKVLATVDESTYDEDDGNTDRRRPPGRVVLGLRRRPRLVHGAWATRRPRSPRPTFRAHLLGGLRTAAGRRRRLRRARARRRRRPTTSRRSRSTTTRRTRWSSTSPTTGASSTSSATGGSRSGSRTRSTTVTAGTVPVTLSQENGLLGIQLAPDFDTSGNWSTSPTRRCRTPSDTQRASSRFTLNGDTLDLASEQIDLHLAAPARGVLPLVRLARLRRPTATSTSPRATTPTRSTPTASTRSTSAPAAPFWDAQRTSANTNDLQRQDPAHQADREPDRRAGRRHDATRSRPGNLFDEAAGHDEQDPARDLRDGLPQPVPDHGRPEDRLGADGRLRPGRRHHEREPRPAGLGRVQRASRSRATTAGRTASATTSPYNDYNFATSTSGAEVQLRRAGQRLAQQHGPDQPAAGQPARGVDGLHRDRPALPGPRHGRRPDGRPALPLRPEPGLRHASSPRSTTTSGSSASGTTAGSRPPTSTPTGAITDVSTRSRSARATCARWTWSSVPTARCTSIEWGSGFNGEQRRLRRLPGRLHRGRAAADRPRHGRQRRRPRAADGPVLLAPAPATRTARRSPTRGTSTATARPTRPPPTRRTPTRPPAPTRRR